MNANDSSSSYTDYINDVQNLLDSKPSIANLERDLDVYKT